MNELNLGLTTGTLPQHRNVTAGVYKLALLFHLALFVSLVWAGRIHPVRVATGPMVSGGLAAWVPGTIAGPAEAPKSTPVAEPKKPAPTAKATRPADTIDRTAGDGQSGTTSGAAGVGSGSGPVRLGSGGDVTLLKRVQPIYPPQ